MDRPTARYPSLVSQVNDHRGIRPGQQILVSSEWQELDMTPPFHWTLIREAAHEGSLP